jgi:hypothetical protein
MNPNGGAGGRRVMEVLPLDPIPLERVVSAVDVDSVSGYGPMISANRLVRLPAGGQGPACGVVWGGTAKCRPLPDYGSICIYL